MPALKISREAAVDRIAEVFRRHGYDGATLSLLSQATGLGRASLYHHFPGGKQEMARAVFARIGSRFDAEVLEPLRGKEAPEVRLRAWARAVGAFYAGGGKNCLLGAMVLSGGTGRFGRELAGAFRGWIDALARVLEEAGLPRGVARRRAESAVGQVQGALIVARGTGDEAVFARLLDSLPAQLLEPARVAEGAR